jgi:hypothetical protein
MDDICRTKLIQLISCTDSKDVPVPVPVYGTYYIDTLEVGKYIIRAYSTVNTPIILNIEKHMQNFEDAVLRIYVSFDIDDWHLFLPTADRKSSIIFFIGFCVTEKNIVREMKKWLYTEMFYEIL